MGQYPSTSSSSVELNRRDTPPSEGLGLGWDHGLDLPSIPPESSAVPDLGRADDDAGGGVDFTSELPDECLAHVFHFLGSGDRKRCSLVCRRWLRVDGESRHRLSLDAQADLLNFIPPIFARYDSISKLSLRCDRKSISINDDALILIALRCTSLSRLKLRGCRELTDLGIAAFSQHAKNLRKFSCGSCSLGAGAVNAILDHCTGLEEISIKRLRGIHDGAELIGPGVAAKSLKSICLKEIINGQCFGPLIIGAKGLKTLKLIRCLGDWDSILQTIGSSTPSLIEVHFERIQLSDAGLAGISHCKGIEILHIVKIPECSNLGLCSIAENCTQLRKFYIDGWRINRIGDEGLVAIAKQCPNLQELVLIGVNATHSSLSLIASNCPKLERLALCGSDAIRDAEIACIATKCEALRKLCIKGCPITDVGIESLALGCPNLVKIKVRKCRGVSNQVAEWLRERKGSLIFNLDAETEDEIGVQESAVEFAPMFAQQAAAPDVPSSSNDRSTMFRAKLGLFAGRNFVACTFRRWSNGENSSGGNL
ncbi:F-box protein SKIP2 [Punica granatum]|uniref:F-box protein SKIP2 n=1 Tax=Punica granatum TaxID=22663 RepID=A0A218W0C9_PUNGR|nr:F-box protein SKIP2 [Punica granatum]OWM66287.1 hypothetical protein CDL15_Pgr013504 [Punica granatum]